mmetsp:Transcript_15845/g.19642  ORF Transcript_15845/g.19642 Transcript_15845/m.19642 type:complete len:227 (-) Transcript_15845:52-732(-)
MAPLLQGLETMPSSVVYPKELSLLNGLCFLQRTDSHSFEFCPFQNITQVENDKWLVESSKKRMIGIWTDWVNTSTMLYSNGDRCVGNVSRRALVHFECPAQYGKMSRASKKSVLESVEEVRICFYVLRFRSPFACNLNFHGTTFPPTAHVENILTGPEFLSGEEGEEMQNSGQQLGDKEYIRRLEWEVVRLNQELEMMHQNSSYIYQKFLFYWSLIKTSVFYRLPN